jgi:hypothetical protein
MGWLKKIAPPHRCRFPVGDYDAQPGSIWECEDCSRQWKLTSSAPGRTWQSLITGQYIDREQDR